MKRIATLFAALGLFAVTGCAWFQSHHSGKGEDTKPVATYERINFEGEKATEEERAICHAAGGEVMRAGLLGWENCIQPYSDAGAVCKDSSDCQGKCLADDMGDMDQMGTGSCQQTDSPFGCYAEMENGRVGPGLCVD